MNEVAEPREVVLEAMAELLDDQARVARAEAALAIAKKRRVLSELRLGRLQRSRDALVVHIEQMAVVTMRARLVEAMEAQPDEVFTPVGLAAAVGASNRDSVRNTLLVLARKGEIEKVGVGRYRAREGWG